MLNFIIKYKRYFIGIILGAVAGYLYWYFIGCTSGTCPITSKWYNSSVYGAIFGVLLAAPGKKSKQSNETDQNKNNSEGLS